MEGTDLVDLDMSCFRRSLRDGHRVRRVPRLGRGQPGVLTRRAAGQVALAATAVVLLALTLRIAVASLSPLLTVIGRDFDVPAAVVGLIGMAPPVAFALSGMVTPAIERRWGLERTVLAAAVLGAIMLSSRALAVDAWTLLAATAGVFAAVGVANVLLPSVVKKYFPRRIGLMTTMYSTTMAVATFTPPLVAVPLAAAVGWRGRSRSGRRSRSPRSCPGSS